MQQRRRSADALDAKHTRLADAKAENDALRRKRWWSGVRQRKMPCAILSRNLQRLRRMGNDATVELSGLLDETFSVSGTGYRDQTALRTLQGIHQDTYLR